MARYRGPKTKKARAFGEAIYGPDRAFDKRKYRPGQHGNSRRRRQSSDYAVQLMEKQKAKYTYGVLERQFRNLFERANGKSGVTGEILLQYLEAVTNIPSLTLRPDDVVSVRGKSQGMEVIANSATKGDVRKWTWLEWNPERMEGRFISYPEREQIPEKINEQLIVELYSK